MRYRYVLILALGWLWSAPVSAQSSQSPGPDVQSAESSQCQIAGASMSGDRPLPRVQAALKERKTIRILSIGTSSSALMRETGESYFEIIEKLLEKAVRGADVQIMDRSVSGELAKDAADRLKTEVALESPDLVLWQLGGNDALARIPVEVFEETVAETLDWLKGHGVDVAVIGMQYVGSLNKDQHYQDTRRALQRVVDNHKVLRIARYEATQMLAKARDPETGNLPNDFAVTDIGYECLSEYVARAVASAIALKAPNAAPRDKLN